MTVVEGLRRIQKHWPEARFQMAHAERLEVMHQRLRELATGPEPETMRDLIRRMDEVGLGVRGKTVILS